MATSTVGNRTCGMCSFSSSDRASAYSDLHIQALLAHAMPDHDQQHVVLRLSTWYSSWQHAICCCRQFGHKQALAALDTPLPILVSSASDAQLSAQPCGFQAVFCNICVIYSTGSTDRRYWISTKPGPSRSHSNLHNSFTRLSWFAQYGSIAIVYNKSFSATASNSSSRSCRAYPYLRAL